MERRIRLEQRFTYIIETKPRSSLTMNRFLHNSGGEHLPCNFEVFAFDGDLLRTKRGGECASSPTSVRLTLGLISH